jgi:hypothetical protein
VTDFFNGLLEQLTVDNGNAFTRLPSADEAITTMRDLASPVGAFVREQCEINPQYEIGVDDLYAAYKRWAEDNGHSRKSKETLAMFRFYAQLTPAAIVLGLALCDTDCEGKTTGDRAGPGCLNSFSTSISGASAGVRLPSGEAAA